MDLSTKVIIGLSLVLLLVALFAMNQFASVQSQKEIARVQLMLQQANTEKAQLAENIAGLESEKAAVVAERDQLYRENEAAKERIAQLEVDRQETRKAIRLVDDEDTLLANFIETYPEVSRAKGFGYVDIELPSGRTKAYLTMPPFFAETFVIEHKALETATAQLKEYQDNEVRYGDIRALSSKVEFYDQRMKSALNDANEKCHVRVQAVADRYISKLEQPRFELPGGAKMLGCAALGVAGGILIKETW